MLPSIFTTKIIQLHISNIQFFMTNDKLQENTKISYLTKYCSSLFFIYLSSMSHLLNWMHLTMYLKRMMDKKLMRKLYRILWKPKVCTVQLLSISSRHHCIQFAWWASNFPTWKYPVYTTSYTWRVNILVPRATQWFGLS